MNVETDEMIALQAAQWLERLKKPTPADCAEFVTWLRQAPEHAKELLIAQGQDVLLGAMMRTTQHDTKKFLQAAFSNVREFGDATNPRERPYMQHDSSRAAAASPAAAMKDQATPNRATRARWYAAAAVFVVALCTAATVVFQFASNRSISTGAGEWQTEVLDDGTNMRVGPRTKLVIEFTEERRVVRLVYGEALFDVAKNPRRPFLVETELATARAVGTAFAVSAYDPRQVRVTVKEGVVAVTRAAPRQGPRTGGGAYVPSPPITLTAGEEVEITPAGPLATKQVNLETALAWSTGKLVFERDPLDRAVLEFNRRNKLQITVADRVLRELPPVTGKFNAADPETFAKHLASFGTVALLDVEAGTLLIAPAPHPMTTEASE